MQYVTLSILPYSPFFCLLQNYKKFFKGERIFVRYHELPRLILSKALHAVGPHSQSAAKIDRDLCQTEAPAQTFLKKHSTRLSGKGRKSIQRAFLRAHRDTAHHSPMRNSRHPAKHKKLGISEKLRGGSQKELHRTPWALREGPIVPETPQPSRLAGACWHPGCAQDLRNRLRAGPLPPYLFHRFSSTLTENDTASDNLKCNMPPKRSVKLFIHGIGGIHIPFPPFG